MVYDVNTEVFTCKERPTFLVRKITCFAPPGVTNISCGPFLSPCLPDGKGEHSQATMYFLAIKIPV